MIAIKVLRLIFIGGLLACIPILSFSNESSLLTEGAWEIVEFSPSSDNPLETFDSYFVFLPNNVILEVVSLKKNKTQINTLTYTYSFENKVLLTKKENEEAIVHPLSKVENGIKVGVPFGYFVLRKI